MHRSNRSKPGPGSPSFSFLFVVNQLVFYSSEQCDHHRDQWFNTLPPRCRQGYESEIQSRVMRYQAGVVTEAQGYYWHRRGPCQPGYCFSAGGDILPPYGSSAVFACNPLLPVVVIRGDPMVLTEKETSMQALHFFHPSNRALQGISQATTMDYCTTGLPLGGSPVKYVAVSNPSWIPDLVPETYVKLWAGTPPSRGLGGKLPIVLGLMAFGGASANRVDEVYLGRNGHRGFWRDRCWVSDQRPSHLYPRSTQEAPVGFYVVVLCDHQNPTGSTPELIRHFELEDVAVAESAPSSSHPARL